MATTTAAGLLVVLLSRDRGTDANQGVDGGKLSQIIPGFVEIIN